MMVVAPREAVEEKVYACMCEIEWWKKKFNGQGTVLLLGVASQGKEHKTHEGARAKRTKKEKMAAPDHRKTAKALLAIRLCRGSVFGVLLQKACSKKDRGAAEKGKEGHAHDDIVRRVVLTRTVHDHRSQLRSGQPIAAPAGPYYGKS